MDQDKQYQNEARAHQARTANPRNEPSGPTTGCGPGELAGGNRLSFAAEAIGPNPHYVGPIERAMSSMEHRCLMAIRESDRAEARGKAARRAFEILQKNPELGEFYDLMGQF